ncbi:MAG: hypothetical protein E7259_06000 [Lachnospiraceae bacterium]|nr:hypothetical protein [Lachnospiraceae bacterium]
MSDIMKFKDFLDEVTRRLPLFLTQYELNKIHVEEVCKNNGIICTSLVVSLRNENMSPSIYMDCFYELYRQGTSIENIINKIVYEYENARKEMSNSDIVLPNKDNVKDKIFMRLVNYERNKTQFEDCPLVPYHDLAITFRYLVKNDENGIASAIVRNKDLEEWDISNEQLYDIAKDNTRRLFPPELRRLDDMLREYDENIDIPEDSGLHILTNQQHINGATYMVYEDIIKEFAQNNNSDVYILPSSIHEVLLLPAKEDINKANLEEMVKEINEYVVSPLEYLSDTVYKYDLREFCVKI